MCNGWNRLASKRTSPTSSTTSSHVCRWSVDYPTHHAGKHRVVVIVPTPTMPCRKPPSSVFVWHCDSLNSPCGTAESRKHPSSLRTTPFHEWSLSPGHPAKSPPWHCALGT